MLCLRRDAPNFFSRNKCLRWGELHEIALPQVNKCPERCFSRLILRQPCAKCFCLHICNGHGSVSRERIVAGMLHCSIGTGERGSETGSFRADICIEISVGIHRRLIVNRQQDLSRKTLADAEKGRLNSALPWSSACQTPGESCTRVRHSGRTLRRTGRRVYWSVITGRSRASAPMRSSILSPPCARSRATPSSSMDWIPVPSWPRSAARGRIFGEWRSISSGARDRGILRKIMSRVRLHSSLRAGEADDARDRLRKYLIQQ